ncbi:ATP-binding cassette domain-containing protein [Brachybacterium sp. GPGPB12]|uniref:ATP-binding cassette domain-containing protein n=1 Tax=Brachybacterium sp. GPGPB12 TaxID=3023517 RepID=UPI0031346359
MIGFENVRKEYPGGTLAVEDFTLEIASHEAVALVGTSGSGKTTLMRMINRMVDPTSGRVTIDGEDVAGMDPVAPRRSIGYVMQASGLLAPSHRAGQHHHRPRRRGTAKGAARERARELMDTVGLDPELASRYPAQLSGGQQRASASPAASPPTRTSCSWTSPSAPSTRSCARSRRASCSASSASRARRSSSSPTTSTRPSASATAS